MRETLADELERLSDPRLGLVTITGVDVSPDLRHATVYYSALGRARRRRRGGGARSRRRPHLRAALGRQVRLKYLPALHFREDPAIETGQRIEEIIRDLHRDEEPSDDE